MERSVILSDGRVLKVPLADLRIAESSEALTGTPPLTAQSVSTLFGRYGRRGSFCQARTAPPGKVG